MGFPWHTTKEDFSLLAFLFFDNFFHHNHKISHSVIRLCVVVKHAPKLEQNKIISIIGVKFDYGYKIISQKHLWVDTMNNWTQNKFHPDIVKLYFHMDNIFIHILNMLHLKVCMTALIKISNLPKWSCVLNCCSECLGIFSQRQILMMTKICKLHFVFINTKIVPLVFCTRRSKPIKFKRVLCACI